MCLLYYVHSKKKQMFLCFSLRFSIILFRNVIIALPVALRREWNKIGSEEKTNWTLRNAKGCSHRGD